MFVLKGKRRRGSPVKVTKGLARGRPNNAKSLRRNAKGYSQSDLAKKSIADQNCLRLDAQMNASLNAALQSTGGVALEKAHLVDQFWDRVRQERAYKLVILRADKRIVEAIAFVYLVFETICTLNDWHRELHIQKLAELTMTRLKCADDLLGLVAEAIIEYGRKRSDGSADRDRTAKCRHVAAIRWLQSLGIHSWEVGSYQATNGGGVDLWSRNWANDKRKRSIFPLHGADAQPRNAPSCSTDELVLAEEVLSGWGPMMGTEVEGSGEVIAQNGNGELLVPAIHETKPPEVLRRYSQPLILDDTDLAEGEGAIFFLQGTSNPGRPKTLIVMRLGEMSAQGQRQRIIWSAICEKLAPILKRWRDIAAIQCPRAGKSRGSSA